VARNLSPKTENRIREYVEKFLKAAPLEESTLLFDGPGIGCTSHALVIGYLGKKRLTQLKAVHSFSSASYGTLFALAELYGMLTLDKSKTVGWNRENQVRHQVTYPGQFLGRIPSLLRQGFLFPHQLTQAALSCSVSSEFVERKVKDISPNAHFWVYNKTDNRLEDIHALNPQFSHWKMGEVISAAVSIPYIYEPFRKDGKLFRDPFYAPTIREKIKELKVGKNVLFWNMKYSAEKESLLAVKGHESKSGLRRIIFDEVRFLLGLKNIEFDKAIEKGLFEIEPLK
jgi:hypothetical protein